MANVEEFEVLLKEVVNAKRLSASKMEKLTELSMKLMENDTQLVSILFRTHKSVRGSAKISSLYVFDALCRAARSQVIKRKLSGDANTEKGNCATFLSKVDSVLDGLFQDVLSSGVPEAKEKTKKILDIWTKSSTFPSSVLTRLNTQCRAVESSDQTVKEAKPATSNTPTPTTDPRKHPTPPAVITPPPAASTTTPPNAEPAQAALLALLSTAAAANNSVIGQTPANISNPPAPSLPQTQNQAQLGQLQLALLQQLSNNGGHQQPGIAGAPPQPQVRPIPQPIMTGMSPFIANPNMVPQNNNMFSPSTVSPVSSERQPNPGPGYRESRPSRFDEAPDSAGRGEYYHDNQRRGVNARGFRGGFQGRGRGDFRGEYDRDYESSSWDRGRDDYYEGGPPPNRRRLNSNSRSPPPRRRDNRQTYSPPRRPSIASPVERPRAPLPGASEPGKDEFGRDIRPGSEEPEESRRRSEGAPPGVHEGGAGPDTIGEAATAQLADPRAASLMVVDSSGLRNTHSNTTNLENFDISTFDPTSADAWQALGDAFQGTHGYVPSQEELLQLVMASMETAMTMGMGKEMDPNGGENSAGTSSRGADTGRETTWDRQTSDMYSIKTNDENSDTVVPEPPSQQLLSSKEGGVAGTEDMGTPAAGTGNEVGSGNRGGQMRKVGNRWIFIRDSA